MPIFKFLTQINQLKSNFDHIYQFIPKYGIMTSQQVAQYYKYGNIALIFVFRTLKLGEMPIFKFLTQINQ